MKVLLDGNLVERFDSKKLYSQVNDLFTYYNMKQFEIRSLKNSPYKDSLIFESDIEKVDDDIKYIMEFDSKISFIKDQLTEDEEEIYKYSIEEGELDKIIMDRICKSGHKYYEIKKSCYLKIALAFGLIKLKKSEHKEVFAKQF